MYTTFISCFVIVFESVLTDLWVSLSLDYRSCEYIL